MKARYTPRFLPLLVGTVSFAGHSVGATNQYWNAGGTGGDGNWSTSPGDKNWNIVNPGSSANNTVWPDTGDEVAAFGDATGGTVTVIDTVQAAGIIQSGANYTINAGVITLTRDAALTQPFIEVQTGTLTIDSILDGADGLRTSGSGNLLLSNSNTYTGTTSLTAGTLTLSGSLMSDTIQIAAGAGLLDQAGGLAAGTVLTNTGELTVNAADAIATYISNGGTLAAGSGTLTTTLADLNDGSIVAGLLDAGSLSSDGAVAVSGTIAADVIQVAGGVLTNYGTLGTAATLLDIAGGATLAAGGAQQYALLTTSGTEAGTWQANLTNPATIAPGGQGGIGTLQVNGNFTNAAGGILQLDLAAAGHDLLDVSGAVSFDGTLELHQVGTASMAPFESINVVAADSYAGNFATLVADLDGTVWFNPGNGDVTRMAVPTASGNKLFGSTVNQTSTWVALYDDVIDPGVTNITYTPGGNPGYHITGGIADVNNPDLLWAQAFSFTPTGLNSNLLNRLSPEVYVSFQDYAMQATRTHQRTALSAPALAATPIPAPKPDSKGGCKDAAPVTTAGLQWEFFAATDYFNVATTNSHNQADYELSGLGVMAGVRAMVTDRIKLAGYLAGDDGNVEGSLIDADGNGWSLGLLGEVLLEEKSRTHLTAGISYGRYTFDGTRGSASATASGWTHGLVDFDDLDCDSLELYIGVEGVIYQNDRFRLIPSLGLHYATGSMDSFTETTGVPAGSPIALEVNHENYDSALAEFSLLAEVDATNNLTLWAQLGASAGIGQDPYSTSGNFVKGSRTLRAEADGLSNDLWFIGLGANYKISDSISVNLGYRSEFRSDADSQNSFNLSCSFRF